MATARDIFLERITNFNDALSSNDLISRALTDIAHNEKAKMLRNGMAIIGFTILEDFIKKRLGEVFRDIGHSGIGFNDLPSKLKEASILNALKCIQARSDNLRRAEEDYLTFIQEETKRIGSTQDSVFELSEYSLGWDKPNLSHDDISNYLSTFYVEGGWNAIKSISTIINISLTNPAEIFRNSAQRRHRAAHNPQADSSLLDLQYFVSQATVIAIGFDLLLSKSLKHIKNRNQRFLDTSEKTNVNQIHFRFLIEENNKWKEYKTDFIRAFRVANDYNTLFSQCLDRARRNSEVLVIKSANNQIKNWYVTEL